jgi:hypothetical protein
MYPSWVAHLRNHSRGLVLGWSSTKKADKALYAYNQIYEIEQSKAPHASHELRQKKGISND